MDKAGSVTLVGAGCGKDLITLKGLSELQKADVVVYDDLIDRNLLLETRADCRQIYVGKRMGEHSRSQEEIHRLLAEKAKEGKRVVRLKGGDGFVFGRGGEEILYLQKERIPYEVVAGVSSGIAVPGHAGIPVTHRTTAQSVTIVTGHSASGKEENYKALAELEGTLVFLMGLSRIEEITRALLANGKAPDTPASILSRGYSAREKRIDAALCDIASKAGQARTPAVLVVGQTAELHLEGALCRKLDRVFVTVTGTKAFVKKAVRCLSELGAEAQGCPCLEIAADYENIPQSFEGFDWLVFTSANGVEVFFDGLFLRKTDLRRLSLLKFACIGPGTSASLAEHGIYADFQPAVSTAKALGQELALRLKPGERALLLRAKEGSPELAGELRRGGISFEDRGIYHTQVIREGIRGFCSQADYIVFGSARGAEAFLESGDFSALTKPVCIGPETQKAFGKIRNETCLVPEKYTIEGIAEEIIKDTERRRLYETIQEIETE